MDKYLFKISLEPNGAWSKYLGKAVKPVYFVANNRAQAEKWAKETLDNGVSIKSISRLARQLAHHVYSGNIKPDND